MRIVKPSVELLWITPEAEKIIERAGRTCYKSEDKITDDSAGKFVRMLIERGHEAMIEHASASFLWITDRGVTHELVRHRLVSYAQESTRYCNYEKQNEIAVIEPPGLDEYGNDAWRRACCVAEKSYLEMIGLGLAPQIARSVLPTCLKTEIVVTANLREWRHICRLRTSSTAHPQIQEMAKLTLSILKEFVPTVFEDFSWPSVRGYCN